MMKDEEKYLEAVREYEKVEKMTLEEVQDEYGCDWPDAKEVILKDLQTEIDDYGREMPEEEVGTRLDPAFGSWAEVNAMFYSTTW